MIDFRKVFTASLGLISERLNSKSLGDCAFRISYSVGLNQSYLVKNFDDDAGILIFGVMIIRRNRIQHRQIIISEYPTRHTDI